MSPSWPPMCKAMQLHCEPFYGAVMQWVKYEDRKLVKNRIQMLHCVKNLYQTFGSNKVEDTYVYDIVTENPNYELLPEIIPVAGKQYVEGGDQLSYTKLKSDIPSHLFVFVGLFFQGHLLKPIAGWNDEILLSANLETRESITRCVEKLYRIPESAGKLHFISQKIKSFNKIVESAPTAVELAEVTDDHLIFYEFLVNYMINQLKKRSEQSNQSNTQTISTSKKDKTVFHKDGRAWLTDVDVVGTQIARYFPTECQKVLLFTGNVVRYLPETPGKGNHLYHVIFDDDYGIDITEKEFQDGLKNLEEANPWVTDHESIGWKVAAKFPVKEGKKTMTKTFKGKVVKYSPATKEGLNDQLYNILFEDGDKADWEFPELQAGLKLFQETFVEGRKPVIQPSTIRKNKPSTNPSSNSDTSWAEKQIESTPAASASKSSTSGPSASWHHNAKNSGSSNNSMPSRSHGSGNGHSLQSEDDQGLQDSDILIGDEVIASIPPTNSSVEKESKTEFAEEGKQENESVNDDIEVWTTEHESIGWFVAKHFYVGKKWLIFCGKVISYCLPSSEGQSDQLYKIEFEDGDQEDWDNTQLEAGLDLYKVEYADYQPNATTTKDKKGAKGRGKRKYSSDSTVQDVATFVLPQGIPTELTTPTASTTGKRKLDEPSESTHVKKRGRQPRQATADPIWITSHSSIGTNISAYFPCDATFEGAVKIGRKTMRPYNGKVVKYAEPSDDNSGDQLYHIEWEDGDVEDYDEIQLNKGIELYQHVHTLQGQEMKCLSSTVTESAEVISTVVVPTYNSQLNVDNTSSSVMQEEAEVDQPTNDPVESKIVENNSNNVQEEQVEVATIDTEDQLVEVSDDNYSAGVTENGKATTGEISNLTNSQVAADVSADINIVNGEDKLNNEMDAVVEEELSNADADATNYDDSMEVNDEIHANVDDN